MSQKRYIVIIKLPGSGGLLPQAEDSHCFPRSTNCENSFDQEMSSI